MPTLVKNEQNDRQRVVFNFTDVTVIESDEPYPFPIATVEVPYNPEGKNNSWDVWKRSMYAVFGDQNYDTMFERLADKEQEWWYGDCEIRRPGDEGSGEDDASVRSNWKLRPSKAWQIVQLEGAGGAATTSGKTLNEAAVELLVGKTREQFQAAVFSPEGNSLKAYGAEYNKLVEQLSQQQYLPALVALGMVTVDENGVYSKS